MLIDFKTLVSKYNMKIKRILHVGAHFCEERDAYNSCGIRDKDVYWIEGNKDIVQQVKTSTPSINIYNGLVSDTDGKNVDFIITNNGQSSSILELQEHRKEHPHVVEIARRQQQTCRLDTLIQTHDIPAIDFMNIDIQGAELLALKGMGMYLNHVKYIYTEVNTKHLYKDCALIGELDSFLLGHGFVRKETSMTQHGWGDALYVRERLPAENLLIMDFIPNSCGGLGDRLVGLVSAIMLSKISNRKLLINFQEPPETDHLWTVSCPYKPYASILDSHHSFIMDSIDNRFKYKRELQTFNLNTWWNTKVVRLRVNQEIASFVYDNPNYPHLKQQFERDSRDVYENLFMNYLVLRQKMTIHQNPQPTKKVIGLQVRCGDLTMGCGQMQFISSEKLRSSIIPMLHENITKHWNSSEYALFVTTDLEECYRLISQQFKDYTVFKIDGLIDHFEKQGRLQGTEKTVRDLATLAKANVLVISSQSNFGRVAALMNPTSEIFAFDFNAQWKGHVSEKKRLCTKHQSNMESLDI